RPAFGIYPAALDAGRIADRGYVFHAFWRRGDSLATGRAARKSQALGCPHTAAVKTGDRLRFSQFQCCTEGFRRRAHAVSLADHSSEIGKSVACHQFSGNAGSGPAPFGVSITRTIFRSGTETTTILSWS